MAATVLLYNEMLRKEVRPAQLAKRMSIPRQEVTRLLNRRHATKIDTISDVFRVLGKRLELSVA